MLTRSTKLRLIAFAVISVVFLAYALLRFTDIGKVFGVDGYSVTVRLDETGGIFPRAEVVYRGVPVGRVGQLSLTDDGLIAKLNIEPDQPPIPADIEVQIANLSAVGEQYVGLRPQSQGGPYLQQGSVIPASKVSVPVKTGELVSDLNRLAKSVPKDALRTVVDEAYQAFRGTGDDLGVLLDTLGRFTRAAEENLPETVRLLRTGGTVLETQNDVAGSFKSFSSDLQKLTETLKSSDADLRRLIDVTPKVSKTLSEFIRETGPGLSSVIANLLTTSNLVVRHLDGVEQALVTYPLLSVGAQTVAPGDGTAHLGLILNFFNPPPCVRGYPYAQNQVDGNPGTEGYRAGTNTTPRPPSDKAYCAEPKGSPIAVRGAQNAPYPGKPVSPSPAQVEASDQRDEKTLEFMRQVPGVAGGPGMEITSLDGLLGLT